MAIVASATVDAAFSNPKSFEVVSDAIGYGIANACMDGNVSLLQTIIELLKAEKRAHLDCSNSPAV